MAQPVAVYTDAREEHLATRRSCGLFDFSFMGQFEVAGADARAFLDRLQTRNLALLKPGRIAYTLLLRPDGTVFIDATVWCLTPDRYWLFTGRRSDFGFLAEAAQEQGVTLRDLSGANAVLALQGPQSVRVLERHLGSSPELGYFGFREAKLAGVPVTIGRLGYSGELGYELILPSEVAPVGLRRKLAADARECGFDAANSLRVESGYILFANELARPVNPFELGLERLVSFDGRAFTGSGALRALRWREPDRRLVGFAGFERRDPASLAWIPSRRGDQPGRIAELERRAGAGICSGGSGGGGYGRLDLRLGAGAHLPVAVPRSWARAAAAGRLTGYEPGYRGFESCQARQSFKGLHNSSPYHLRPDSRRGAQDQGVEIFHRAGSRQVEGQLAQRLAGQPRDGVGERGRQRRQAGLAHAGGRFGAGHDVDRRTRACR